MARQIDFAGRSGAQYRYMEFAPDSQALLPSGANYLICRPGAEGGEVLYAGETENLAIRSWEEPLAHVRRTHGEAVMFVRLNVLRATRKAEQTDIVEAHKPPLNEQARA